MAGTYKNKAYTLRLPNELREKVEEIARAERRPVNTQYEIIVSDWLKWYDAKQGGEQLFGFLKFAAGRLAAAPSWPNFMLFQKRHDMVWYTICCHIDIVHHPLRGLNRF